MSEEKAEHNKFMPWAVNQATLYIYNTGSSVKNVLHIYRDKEIDEVNRRFSLSIRFMTPCAEVKPLLASNAGQVCPNGSDFALQTLRTA